MYRHKTSPRGVLTINYPNTNLVSIIIPAKNEGISVYNTLKSLYQSKTNICYEVIVVDDHSNDGCCDFIHADEQTTLIQTNGLGAAMARNIGARNATGDILIFCDAHLFFQDFWIDRLIEPINKQICDAINPGISDVYNRKQIGYGYKWNERLEAKWNTDLTELSPVPLLAGGCLAVTKIAFEQVGGFEYGFKTWGHEDEELSLKLWLFGYSCYVEPDVIIMHVFREDEPPFPLSWEDINYNFLRMAYLHFNEERLIKCLNFIKHTDSKKIKESVLSGDVLQQRKRYKQIRKYDDDWYMEKFQIPF